MSNTVIYDAAEDTATSAIVPVVMICDSSSSMGSGPGPINPIDALNTGLATLVNTLKVHPEAADTALVEIIDFSSTANVVTGFEHIKAISAPPILRSGGSTNYGAAFSLARRELEAMYAKYTAGPTPPTIYRPTIYLVTDGGPTDPGWEAELDTLGSLPYAPNICVFGVQGADEAVLRKVARRDRGMVWLAKDGVDPAEAFAALFPALVRTVMQTAAGVAAGPGAAVPAPTPGNIPGMRMLDAIS